MIVAGSGSARGLALTVTDGRRYPGSDTGSACSGEVATASGGRDTESSVAGRESSGDSGIRESGWPVWLARMLQGALLAQMER